VQKLTVKRNETLEEVSYLKVTVRGGSKIQAQHWLKG